MHSQSVISAPNRTGEFPDDTYMRQQQSTQRDEYLFHRPTSVASDSSHRMSGEVGLELSPPTGICADLVMSGYGFTVHSFTNQSRKLAMASCIVPISWVFVGKTFIQAGGHLHLQSTAIASGLTKYPSKEQLAPAQWHSQSHAFFNVQGLLLRCGTET